ncbi:hypothetical protein ACFXTI_046778 [Malus domestica]
MLAVFPLSRLLLSVSLSLPKGTDALGAAKEAVFVSLSLYRKPLHCTPPDSSPPCCRQHCPLFYFFCFLTLLQRQIGFFTAL